MKPTFGGEPTAGADVQWARVPDSDVGAQQNGGGSGNRDEYSEVELTPMSDDQKDVENLRTGPTSDGAGC
jgi:hypothetical protein